MEPLITSRKCLVWLYVYPADESSSKWQKLAHATFATYIIVALIGVVAACYAFSWKFASIDLGKSVYAFMLVFDQFTAIYAVLAGFLLRHKFGKIFDNLTTIYQARKR